jgi:Raf kinase inhibitor-like YbhB/YbcL family protein
MSKTKQDALNVSSSAFEDEGDIPSKYTCDGEEINPPLFIENIPDGTQALAIIVEDPDAPKGTFDHWLVWNIPPERIIQENRIPGISGKNGAGKTGYHGPCPPSGSHRYYFHVFALDSNLDLPAGSDKKTLQLAIKSHLLAKGSLMGKYKKQTSAGNKKE